MSDKAKRCIMIHRDIQKNCIFVIIYKNTILNEQLVRTLGLIYKPVNEIVFAGAYTQKMFVSCVCSRVCVNLCTRYVNLDLLALNHIISDELLQVKPSRLNVNQLCRERT